ncbi:ABC-type uncharacterized transport system permease subunit [Pedobacter sp. UYP1]|jgi:ABC-type uncharacterized transport system permease subunit
MGNLSKAILVTATLEVALLLLVFFIKFTDGAFPFYNLALVTGETIMVVLISLIGILIVKSMKSDFRIDN